MNWLELLRVWLGGPDLADLATQIAEGSRTAVWQRVGHRATVLGIAEARGYIRVKASHVVREEVDAAIRTMPNLEAWQRPRLEELVMDAVLRQAVLDLLNAQEMKRRSAQKQWKQAA